VTLKSGSFKLVPFESLGAVSYLPSIVTMALFHQFRDKAGYWSQIVIISYPLAFGAPVSGVPVGVLPSVWYGKTRIVGLPDGEKTLSICVTIYTQYRRVTDGRTDRHLDTA